MSAKARRRSQPKASPHLKFPLRQILIAFTLAVTTAIAAIHISPAVIPLFSPPILQATPPPEIQNILKGKHKIVTVGDSITEAGKYTGGYVWLLQRYLDMLYPDQKIEIINAGISGNKSTDMQARFQRDAIAKKPDLITINVGVNDVWSAFFDFSTNQLHPKGELPAGVPLPVYRQKLTEMVQAATAAGIRVALLSPTPIREVLDGPENRRLPEYIATMRTIASQNNCLYIDLNSPFREVLMTYQKHAGRSINLLAADGVHPNQAGNRIIAYTILRSLGIPDRDIQSVQVKY
ncbi:MAG TPA: SGNH/GDSL hydrolase family protein [Kamptonema sp.]|nr:SGNH/GDSL hydrolase family protein [Kamptonema sp.]